MNTGFSKWRRPFGDGDGGVLAGEGYDGTHDGVSFDGRQCHVWHNNQRYSFELSLLELLRLSVGKPVRLASLQYAQAHPEQTAELFADVDVGDARAELARRAQRAFERLVVELRHRGPWHGLTGPIGPPGSIGSSFDDAEPSPPSLVRGVLAGLMRRIEERSAAEREIGRLAYFILDELEGEPSQNESAVDTAIRLLRKAQQAGWRC